MPYGVLKMKLYHYSKELYNVLKTRTAVGGLSASEINEAKETAKYLPRHMW